tara:strand:+ start:2027 stop:3970 length:1944 start_codon:yes stop_codon:yes gene_type:complete
MPITKFTNLDFDQIKTQIKDYLRSNSDFTDFDFEGSNFSVLIDTLAYNTYITAFNSNMIVNESFLDSATLRENVVSLARNIGYTPRSKTAARAEVAFKLKLPSSNPPDTVELKRGLVCVGSVNDTSFTFAISEDVTKIVENEGSDLSPNYVANFENLPIKQGTFITKQFKFENSLDQKFILDNPSIDTSTLHVYVKKNEDTTGLGVEYFVVDGLNDIDSTSRVFFLQEIKDEKYEIRFGDGLIGRKLGSEGISDGDIITANYIVTDGQNGNGASTFSFAGNIVNTATNGLVSVVETPNVITIQKAQGGGDIEDLDSIKYYSPKIYSSQNRAVTARDYEAIIKNIFPETDTVSVVGGEELDPPEFGTVQISIKPKNSTYISDFTKSRILSQLKKFTVSGINQKIVDLKILYIELDISIYYNFSQISTEETLRTKVIQSLTEYGNSVNFNQFGSRFKYSKSLQVIDNTDTAITSNITKVKIRRDLKVAINQSAQYELCFGNQFHVESSGRNIKSTGFFVTGESSMVYLTDSPNPDKVTGTLAIVKEIDNQQIRVVSKSAGVVDYIHGEVKLSTINITGTQRDDDIIEVQAFPESNDVVGLRDLYLSLSVSKSTINMLRDSITSGDEVSGTQFVRDTYTSSYSNGNLIRE